MKERRKSLFDAIERKFEPGLAGDIAIAFDLELKINFVAALNGATLEEHIIASLVVLPWALVARKVGVSLRSKPEISLTRHLFTNEDQL